MLAIKYTVEFEIQYDPFKGKTKQQFAESLHDDLIAACSDIEYDAMFSDVVSIQEFPE